MRYNVAKSFYHPIFDETEGPFVSIYFETSPFAQDRNKNQINLKNMISTLNQQHPELVAQSHQLTELLDDPSFWDQIKQGLAILMSPNENVVYFLPETLKSSLTIGDHFYILPLVRHYQQLNEVQLLLLNRENFKLFQGTYHKVEPLPYPNDEPITADEVLGTDTRQRYFSATPGGRMQGDDGKSGMDDVDMLRYFQYVDKYVNNYVSKVSKLPLILVALPEYHKTFREISENNFLFEQGIKMDFSGFTHDDLATQLGSLLIPYNQALLSGWVNKFNTGQANGSASDFIEDVLTAVLEKRVDTLLISHDSFLYGLINVEDQTYLVDESRSNNLSNEIAVLALKAKSRVLVLDEDMMPTKSPVAMIARF